MRGDTPFLTSIADFYRVDISLVTPRMPAQVWSLSIDGMVDRPLRSATPICSGCR